MNIKQRLYQLEARAPKPLQKVLFYCEGESLEEVKAERGWAGIPDTDLKIICIINAETLFIKD
jgi:hypothetical protein